ncbi:hypothetical protein GF312_22155 [Candidatus Poribacteria bacterium]|nr:hypothetical protein [Candidatus Poribacteria bacterium]
MKRSLVALSFVFVVLLPVSSVNSAIEDGIVIHYSFDNVDDLTVINKVENNIDGTLEGDAQIVPGYFNMGVALNADLGEADPGNSFVRVTDTPELSVAKEFTIASWVNATNFGDYRTIISKTDGGSYAFTVENAVPTAWVHVNGDYLHVIGTTELKTDTWYHMTLTFDGVDAIIYLDGEQEAKGTREGNVTTNGSDFMIGAEPSGKNVDNSYPAWHGILDEFYFYDRVLTKEEINSLIKQASPVEPVSKLTVSWGELKK